MLNIYTCVFSIDLVESVRLQKFVVIGLVSWGLVEILGLLTKIIKNVKMLELLNTNNNFLTNVLSS